MFSSKNASKLFSAMFGILYAASIGASPAIEQSDWSLDELRKLYQYHGKLIDVGGKPTNKSMADLDTVLKVHPDNVNALMRRATAYFDDGDFKNAQSDYERALKADPKCTMAYIGLSRLFTNEDNYNQAQALLDKGMQTATAADKAALLWEKANLLAGRREHDQAILQYGLALNLPPPSKYFRPHMYYERAVQFMTKHQFKDALDDLNQCLELAPGWTDGLRMRARVYFSLGKLQESLRDYNKAIASQEASNSRGESMPIYLEELYAQRAQLYQRLNRPDLSSKDMQSLVQFRKESMHELMRTGQ